MKDDTIVASFYKSAKEDPGGLRDMAKPKELNEVQQGFESREFDSRAPMYNLYNHRVCVSYMSEEAWIAADS